MLVLFLNPATHIGQGLLFEAKEENLKFLSEESKTNIQKVKDNLFYRDVKSTRLINPKQIERGGKIFVNLPEYKQPLTASARYVEYENDDNYTWSGELKDAPTHQKGTIQIIAHKGAVFGYIHFPDANYLIQDFGSSEGSRVTYLLKSDESQQKNTSCGSHNQEQIEKKDSVHTPDLTVEGRSVACPPLIKVLVLYTDNAYNANPNIWQVATSAIAQLNNSILLNSDINNVQLKYALAGTEYLSFSEDPNSNTTLTNLQNNTSAQSLRSQYNADLVILLTQFNYNGNVIGYAFINDNTSNSNQAYGIVNINNALDHLFAHEIGHLMGCRHFEDIPSYTARGFAWQERSPSFIVIANHKTVMNAIPGGSIPYFSNKDVTYCLQYPNPTGTINNNCAPKIKAQAQAISNWNPNNEECIYISGPSYIYNSNQTFTWCGYSSYTLTSISWAYSTNGYNFTTFAAGTCGSKIGSTFPPYYFTIFIKMTATLTSGSGSAVVSRIIPVTNWSYYNYLKGEEIVENRANDTDIRLYPNPTSEGVVLENVKSELAAIPYTVYTLQGKQIKTGIIAHDPYRMYFPFENIPPGMYSLSLHLDKKILHLPIIKTP